MITVVRFFPHHNWYELSDKIRLINVSFDTLIPFEFMPKTLNYHYNCNPSATIVIIMVIIIATLQHLITIIVIITTITLKPDCHVVMQHLLQILCRIEDILPSDWRGISGASLVDRLTFRRSLHHAGSVVPCCWVIPMLRARVKFHSHSQCHSGSTLASGAWFLGWSVGRGVVVGSWLCHASWCLLQNYSKEWILKPGLWLLKHVLSLTFTILFDRAHLCIAPDASLVKWYRPNILGHDHAGHSSFHHLSVSQNLCHGSKRTNRTCWNPWE